MPIAQIARHLALIVRHDARERGPAAPTEIKRTKRCCRRHLLSVYYRAASERFGAAAEFGASGGYEIKLETAGRSPRSITVSTIASEQASYQLGDPESTFIRPFSWSIGSPSSESKEWTSDIAYDYGTLGRALVLPKGPAVMAAYERALAVIRKAHRHERVIAESAPWAIEALWHANSYYWGKTASTPFQWEGATHQRNELPIELVLSQDGQAVAVTFPKGVREPLSYCPPGDVPVYNATATTRHAFPISNDGTFTATVGRRPNYPVQIIRGQFVGGEIYGTVQTVSPPSCGGSTTFWALIGGPKG